MDARPAPCKFDDICRACGNPGTKDNPVVLRADGGGDEPVPIHRSHPAGRSPFPRNWQDFMDGKIGLHQLECVLCGRAPCACRVCETHQMTSCGCAGTGPPLPLTAILDAAARVRGNPRA